MVKHFINGIMATFTVSGVFVFRKVKRPSRVGLSKSFEAQSLHWAKFLFHLSSHSCQSIDNKFQQSQKKAWSMQQQFYIKSQMQKSSSSSFFTNEIRIKDQREQAKQQQRRPRCFLTAWKPLLTREAGKFLKMDGRKKVPYLNGTESRRKTLRRACALLRCSLVTRTMAARRKSGHLMSFIPLPGQSWHLPTPETV